MNKVKFSSKAKLVLAITTALLGLTGLVFLVLSAMNILPNNQIFTILSLVFIGASIVLGVICGAIFILAGGKSVNSDLWMVQRKNADFLKLLKHTFGAEYVKANYGDVLKDLQKFSAKVAARNEKETKEKESLTQLLGSLD